MQGNLGARSLGRLVLGLGVLSERHKVGRAETGKETGREAGSSQVEGLKIMQTFVLAWHGRRTGWLEEAMVCGGNNLSRATSGYGKGGSKNFELGLWQTLGPSGNLCWEHDRVSQRASGHLSISAVQQCQSSPYRFHPSEGHPNWKLAGLIFVSDWSGSWAWAETHYKQNESNYHVNTFQIYTDACATFVLHREYSTQLGMKKNSSFFTSVNPDIIKQYCIRNNCGIKL